MPSPIQRHPYPWLRKIKFRGHGYACFKRWEVKKLKKRGFALFCAVFLLLSLCVPGFALDDDEYSGYAADTLTVKVGYFGGPYYEKHVFTLKELQDMDVVNRDYTFIDDMPSVVIDHVSGVRLADLVDAAGIDLNSAETFYFWTKDKQSDYYTSFSKTALIDTPRYCYFSLPDNFDGDTGGGNDLAVSDGEQVDSLIALADDWNRCIAGATFGSDYLNLNTNTRFRLIFGQTNSYEHTASRSAKWIHEIVVELGGAPTVTLGDTSLTGKVGSVLHTEAHISAADPAIAAGEKIAWSSSDGNVAAVDENGTITVKGEGAAVITASINGASASLTVNGTPGEKAPGTGDGTGNGTGGTLNGKVNGGSGGSDNTGSAAKETAGAVKETGNTAAQELHTDQAQLREVTQAAPGHVEPNSPQTASASKTGGIQNWRMYEMSADAQPLQEQKADNSLLGVIGVFLGGVFVASGAVYAAVFYAETRGKKYVHNQKSH